LTVLLHWARVQMATHGGSDVAPSKGYVQRRLDALKAGVVKGADPRKGRKLYAELQSLRLKHRNLEKQVARQNAKLEIARRLEVELHLVIKALRRIASDVRFIRDRDLASVSKMASFLADQLYAALKASEDGLGSQKQASPEKP
jgi:hypothetical protein